MSGIEIFVVSLWVLCFLFCVMFIWVDARKRNPPKYQKKRKTSNVVLLVLGGSAALFIVAMTVIFCVVEALLLAGIKISKVRAGKGGEDDEEVP